MRKLENEFVFSKFTVLMITGRVVFSFFLFQGEIARDESGKPI